MSKGEGKLTTQDRKVRHDYSAIDTVETRLVLQGIEIKSIRNGCINLKDGFARIRDGETFLYNVRISPYERDSTFNHDPLRTRKLLLHKKQIDKLIDETEDTDITLVPLKVYIKDDHAKVLISLAKGKKQYDKCEDLRHKEVDRQVSRTLKNNRR